MMEVSETATMIELEARSLAEAVRDFRDNCTEEDGRVYIPTTGYGIAKNSGATPTAIRETTRKMRRDLLMLDREMAELKRW